MLIQRCGVVGSPIAHSLSPAMHRAAYAAAGLDWSYDAFRVERGGLADFLAASDLRAVSVTAPLKHEAAALATSRSATVEALGVANTLVPDLGEWRADNTDVPGALAALAERDIEAIASARILGGGATAASLAHALVTAGAASIEVVVRDVTRAGDVLDAAGDVGTVVDLAGAPGHDVDLLVSTLPADAVPERWSTAARAVFDVVYDPWPTPLAASAADRGLTVVSGLDLLAHQAVLQLELMAGVEVRPQVLREAALDALRAG